MIQNQIKWSYWSPLSSKIPHTNLVVPFLQRKDQMIPEKIRSRLLLSLALQKGDSRQSKDQTTYQKLYAPQKKILYGSSRSYGKRFSMLEKKIRWIYKGSLRTKIDKWPEGVPKKSYVIWRKIRRSCQSPTWAREKSHLQPITIWDLTADQFTIRYYPE